VSTGRIFLIVMTFVAISDVFIALRFRRLADRKEAGDPEAKDIDPQGVRRVSTFMLIFSPILFIGAVLISFGYIPVDGIDPISFVSE